MIFQLKQKVNKMNVINVGNTNVSSDCKLTVGQNKKRVGSKAWTRYEAYVDSTTVGQYIDNGGLKADLRYDVAKGFVTLLQKVVKGKIVAA